MPQTSVTDEQVEAFLEELERETECAKVRGDDVRRVARDVGRKHLEAALASPVEDGGEPVARNGLVISAMQSIERQLMAKDSATILIKERWAKAILAEHKALYARPPAKPTEQTDLVGELEELHGRWIPGLMGRTAGELLMKIHNNWDRILSALRVERDEVIDECARVAERRAEVRFEEFGTTEPDTNASYYSGSAAEEYEARDEECEDIAKEIRSQKGKA